MFGKNLADTFTPPPYGSIAEFLKDKSKFTAMNKDRRKRLEGIYEKLMEIYEELDAIIDEEQEAYDNMPESLQDSEKGERMYEGIDNLESARDDINNAATTIEEVIAQ